MIIIIQLKMLSHLREIYYTYIICHTDKRKLVDGPQQFYEICDRMTRIHQIFSFPEIPPAYY